MHSWGSRGRGFKSRRPDAGQRLDRQVCLDFGDHVGLRGLVWRVLTAGQATESVCKSAQKKPAVKPKPSSLWAQ